MARLHVMESSEAQQVVGNLCRALESRLSVSSLAPCPVAFTATYKDYLGEPLSHKAHELLHTNHHSWQMPAEKKTAEQK